MTLSNFSQSDFFSFAERSCAKPIMQEALTHFCEQYHLYQNTLLFHIWFALNQYGRLKKAQISKLYEVSYYWHERIYNGFLSLYKTLEQKETKKLLPLKKSIKLDLHFAELVEQQLLWQALYFNKKFIRNQHQQLADACYNVASLFKFQQLQLRAADQHVLGIILQTVFVELSGEDIIAAIEQALTTSPYSIAKINTQLNLTLEN